MQIEKLKEIKKAFEHFGKKKIVVMIGILGIALILLSEMIPNANSAKTKSNSIDCTQYVLSLEKQTTEIISSISGVGKCKIMLTLAQTDENVFAQNMDESFSDSSNSKRNEYVFYEDNNNDTPILLKQYYPKVNGVVVVCQGGDDVVVQQKVVSAISSLFDIPSNKISVSKLNR